MATAFPQPPIKTPMMGADGMMSMEWITWFSRAFSQISTAAYIPGAVDITGGTITGVTIASAINIAAAGTITGSNLTGTNTGDQTITLSGDVTGSGTGNLAATIAANAVTYAKMQAVGQAALLGAAGGAGAVAEVTLGAGLAFSGGAVVGKASVYSAQTPTTGFSITIPAATGQLILTPAGTLATGTITMPAAPADGDVVGVASTQIVTTLTVQANSGQTLNGTITTIAANGFARWMYRSSTTTWYRVG